MNRLLQILFWSVISAAFIGPGTVTTAASAGTHFGFSLLWALSFSIVACLVLQEASARITIVTGQNLGQAIRKQYQGTKAEYLILFLVVGAIVLGCAAYEAGNILGGVAGAAIGIGWSQTLLTLLIGVIAFLLLYFGTVRIVARILGLIVAIMGIAFLITAFMLKPAIADLLQGTFVPSLPQNSGLFVTALIGTTVVPYNLFLGSGIARGQKLSQFRFGLIVAIILGGIISMGVLVVGTSINGNFSFEALTTALSVRLGGWAKLLFALGLFSAGLSSAITAPLAAAITTKSLFAGDNQHSWLEQSWRYRSVWMGVLFIGIVFGLTDVRPIPAIILAQALNGILLPFVAVFLLLVVNNRRLMGDQQLNRWFPNLLMSLVVMITIILGASNLLRALTKITGFINADDTIILTIAAVTTILLVYPIIRSIRKHRQ